MGLDVAVDILITGRGQAGEQRAKWVVTGLWRASRSTKAVFIVMESIGVHDHVGIGCQGDSVL